MLGVRFEGSQQQGCRGERTPPPQPQGAADGRHHDNDRHRGARGSDHRARDQGGRHLRVRQVHPGPAEYLHHQIRTPCRLACHQTIALAQDSENGRTFVAPAQ